MCSTVEAALDGLLHTVGGTDEEILALLEMRDRVDAALAERVGAFDAAEGWKADGAFSFACWVRARSDVSRAESLQLERFARWASWRRLSARRRAARDYRAVYPQHSA